MILSPGRNYIFVHIPKTGGTSLALALEAKAMADDIMLGDTPKAKKRRRRVDGVQSAGRLWKHSTLRDVVGLVSEDFIANACVFTLVRNPWDRFVSYYHWLRTQQFDHPAIALARTEDFSGFLNHPTTKASLSQNDYSSYVTNQSGQENCQIFLRLEHLAEDVPKLEAILDLKLGAIPHVNTSGRGPYQEYYTAKDAQLVVDISAKDIERFGYRFD